MVVMFCLNLSSRAFCGSSSSRKYSFAEIFGLFAGLQEIGSNYTKKKENIFRKVTKDLRKVSDGVRHVSYVVRKMPYKVRIL